MPNFPLAHSPNRTSPPVRGNGLHHYELLKAGIPNVDHKEYERLAKEAAKRAKV